MAIPGTPQNLNVQTGNQQNLVSWDLSTGATSYIVQRSDDNITFTTIATVTGTPLATAYLDLSAVLGTQYWYKVASSNVDGDSSYTIAKDIISTPVGELSLAAIRLKAQQRADRVGSNFLTLSEWNANINSAMTELYDLLITTYEEYFIADPIQIATTGGVNTYALPTGSNTFLSNTGTTVTPPPFYKLIGVDLAINNSQNAFITLEKFNFIDRNNYIYPNQASSIQGVNNPKYRLMGTNIFFTPAPSGGQLIQLWMIPRLRQLLLDTDTSDISINGWIEYVVVRAAKYALDKEESDSSKLDQQILFLKQRIEESASNRDAGQPDTISNTANSTGGWPFGNRGGF